MMKEEQKGELKIGDSQIILYQTEDGTTKIDVRLENKNVWLSQQQLTELYQTSRTNVVEHIKHIFEEGELNEEATCRKFRQVQVVRVGENIATLSQQLIKKGVTQ